MCMDRSEMLNKAEMATVGTSLFGSQVLASGLAEGKKVSKKGKKALIIGAHPDDPEGNAGGAMILLRRAGWDVVSVYMTRGEAEIKGKTYYEAALIRTQEAIEACKVLDVRPVFMSQVDGSSEVNKDRYAEMQELIAKENPDIVFTHWPIDSHPDHRVCSILVYNAWRRLDYSFELYYFETMNGTQTQYFHPTDYVNISEVSDQKRSAYFCHASQNTHVSYKGWHNKIEQYRGLEFRCPRAEAFIHLRRDNNDVF